MTRLIVATAIVLGLSFSLSAEEPIATPAVYTVAQAAAGRAAYQSVCVNCHTDSLRGRNGDANELPPVSALSAEWQKTLLATSGNGKIPPLAGPIFMARWSTRTTEEFSARVRIAVGGFHPKDMDENTYLALTAYFLQANGALPGTQELTSSTAVVIQATVPTDTADRR